MPQPLSRRSLLIGTGALAFMAACGKKNNNDAINVKDHTETTTRGQKDVLSTVMAGTMFQTGIDERVTFALFQGVPASLVGADTVVKVAFQKPGTRVLTDPVLAERKSEGIEDRPYYVVRHNFDVPGDWGLQAQVDGNKPGNAVITINDPAKVAWATPGKALPKPQTPTPANTLEVNPICTRTPSPCPWHDKSLETLVGNGKPSIVLLATPALCQSATCGPVLDILLNEAGNIGERANLVHVEVYKDTSGKTLSPAFAAFQTESEPVCYFVDKSGVIVDRFNGPFDATEARAAIASLLA
ncbi:MAG: hypothetical protein QOJ00_2328 [Actinomycetota bacterium]